jgi:hypothetical protein
MAKKRTSLEALNLKPVIEEAHQEKASSGRRPHVRQQTVYLPLSVYEQLRTVAFQERKKMHDYLIEGLDRAFQARGLKSIAELTRIELEQDTRKTA